MPAATPDFLIHEAIYDFGGFHAEVLKTSLKVEGDHIIPSKAPGLGIELDYDVISKNSPYIGEELHLQMQEHPVEIKAMDPARG